MNASPEVAYEVRGFTRSHTKSDFSNPGDIEFGPEKTFTPVSSAYKASIDKGEISFTSEDDDIDDDGASQTMAAMTVATFATLYSLLAFWRFR